MMASSVKISPEKTDSVTTILTLNGGSSSLKCALFVLDGTELHCLYRGKVSDILGKAQLQWKNAAGDVMVTEAVDTTPAQTPAQYYQCALRQALAALARLDARPVDAVGHRIVHGGDKYHEPQLLNDDILLQLKRYTPLAPLHQPYNLQLIQACRTVLPDVPHVGCFDTAFHFHQSPIEQRYAIPREYFVKGVRKYGFHGLSYQYIQQQLLALNAGDLNTIVCHLGSGASMCAIKNGQSISSSMGFTPLDGLPMGTRCGAIDPGVLLYLQRNEGLSVDELQTLLYKKSGWLGVSGISGDMLTLEQSDSAEAREAIAHFCYHAALEIGKLTAALGGLQQLVFTGGIGENDALVRADILARCTWLGIGVDDVANTNQQAVISDAQSAVVVRVIPTNEERMIAQEVGQILSHHTARI